jgi:hypothetical protein
VTFGRNQGVSSLAILPGRRPCGLDRYGNPSTSNGQHDGMGAIVGCQLAEDGAHVIADRPLADSHSLADLAIGESSRDERYDLQLTLSEGTWILL